MRPLIKDILWFVVGAAIGSGVTAWFLKRQYTATTQEELNNIMERYKKMKEENPEVKIEQNDSEPDSDNKMVEDYLRYSRHYESTNTLSKEVEEEFPDINIPLEVSLDRPYVIKPEEFGELYDYETVSLTYYADHVLTDDQKYVIEDVDDIIGVDSLKHFGEYEDDSVFVRNDQKKCDYEILLSELKYVDILKKNPYLINDEDDTRYEDME